MINFPAICHVCNQSSLLPQEERKREPWERGCHICRSSFDVTREVKHHVYVKRQTRICTPWPSFNCKLFTVNYFYTKMSGFTPVLSTRIVLDSFFPWPSDFFLQAEEIKPGFWLSNSYWIAKVIGRIVCTLHRPIPVNPRQNSFKSVITHYYLVQYWRYIYITLQPSYGGTTCHSNFVKICERNALMLAIRLHLFGRRFSWSYLFLRI